MVDVLDSDLAREPTPDVLLSAAERLLRELTSRPSLGRDSALDLLTVDALTTYAIECAAAAPATLLDVASAATERLGAIVG
jgi:hypothetical protein